MANESLHGRPLKPEELENIQYQIETVSEIRGIVDGTGRRPEETIAADFCCRRG
jgi:AMMECR1 domain-containing protein